MKNIKAFLFDMDGVLTDTEVQYDVFLEKFRNEYQLPLDFVSQVKGVPLKDIIRKYLPLLSQEEQNIAAQKVINFELTEMQYYPIPGVLNFIEEAKKMGIKLALVTSSLMIKVKVALQYLGLETTFDTLVTADDVIIGKPNPQCYLLATQRLKVNPEECIIFEDSFAGIEAGKRAGISVIGLSTTNSESSIKEKVDRVIPNFSEITPKEILKTYI